MCLVDDSRDIVGLTQVVEDGIALDREICRLPDVGIIQCRGNDIDPEHQRGQNVQDSPCRHDKRGTDVGNLAPYCLRLSIKSKNRGLGLQDSQSNVKGSRPIPLFMPNTWLTTGFCGEIQQTQVK